MKIQRKINENSWKMNEFLYKTISFRGRSWTRCAKHSRFLTSRARIPLRGARKRRPNRLNFIENQCLCHQFASQNIGFCMVFVTLKIQQGQQGQVKLRNGPIWGQLGPKMAHLDPRWSQDDPSYRPCCRNTTPAQRNRTHVTEVPRLPCKNRLVLPKCHASHAKMVAIRGTKITTTKNSRGV